MQDEKGDGQTTEVSESKPQGGRMHVFRCNKNLQSCLHETSTGAFKHRHL